MPPATVAVPRGARRSRVAPRMAEPPRDPATDRDVAFMHEVLMGEPAWRLSEVRRLMELHTLVAIGHWHADGLDDAPGVPPHGAHTR